jgi:hypothetical protein
MDGPNLVLWWDLRLTYPLFGNTVKGIRVSDGHSWWRCFWPFIVDVQCLLVRKKTLNLFFPFVVVAALFKKWKSGYNLPNKKTLPVTEYYYLLFWTKHQNLIAKKKKTKTHLNSKFCEIIFKKHPNFKKQDAYRSVVVGFLLFRQRFFSSAHSCQNGYFSLLHVFSKPFSEAVVRSSWTLDFDWSFEQKNKTATHYFVQP